MIICYIRFLDPNVRYSWIAYPDILTNKVRGFVFLFLKSHVLRFGFVDQLTARIRISDMPASRVRLC